MFYFSIYLSRNKARDLYELLNTIACPEPENNCFICFRYSACKEIRNFIKALKDYLNEREEE